MRQRNSLSVNNNVSVFGMKYNIDSYAIVIMMSNYYQL